MITTCLFRLFISFAVLASELLVARFFGSRGSGSCLYFIICFIIIKSRLLGSNTSAVVFADQFQDGSLTSIAESWRCQSQDAGVTAWAIDIPSSD